MIARVLTELGHGVLPVAMAPSNALESGKDRDVTGARKRSG